MIQGSSKYMRIHIATGNGKIEKIKKDNDQDADTVSASEASQVEQNPATEIIVTKILYLHSSPGCIYVYKRDGSVVKICS